MTDLPYDVLFEPVSAMDEIVDGDIYGRLSPASWILTEDLLNDAEDMDDILNQTRLDFDFDTSSVISSEPQSPPDATELFTEKELITLPIRELNKRLKALPKEEGLKIRKRRRSLKNRSYATICRKRRALVKDNLEEENKRLKRVLSEARQQLTTAVKERNLLRKKYEQLQNVVATLSFSKRH